MFSLIAGPCVIESEELVMTVAARMKAITDELGIPYTFKASFDKANRTSIRSFRGPGIDKGLEILRKVKDTYALPICTDIHEPWQAERAAEVCDVIQIPAFLCRQTDLLVAAAKTGKCINIKKAQFLAPWDMKNCVDKIRASGNDNVMLCERGTTFGYNRLVVDMQGLLDMRKLGYPVILDATHSVQQPGSGKEFTSGNREFAPYMMNAGLAVGVDGIFAEVHPDPDHAVSDGPSQIRLDDIEAILERAKKYDELTRSLT